MAGGIDVSSRCTKQQKRSAGIEMNNSNDRDYSCDAFTHDIVDDNDVSMSYRL